ncbi:MAG: YihY family inner membrane protein [Deltaproteobacteria bacterium]|nr:YihY family inner membrane protein [Deltaproteobacteria bacterium]
MDPKKIPLIRNLGDIARATVFPRDLATSKRRFVLIYFVRLFFLIGRRLWRDHCPRMAAALAFQTLLSLVPLTAVGVAVASALELTWNTDRLVAALSDYVLPEVATDAARRIMDLASRVQPRTMGIVGGVTLIFVSLTMLFNVEAVTNEIFRCRSGRKPWIRVGVGLALLLIAPLALGMSIYFTRELVVLPRFATAWLPLVFSIFAFFLAYWLLPHQKIKLRHSLVSAVFSGVLLEIVKTGFAFYAQHLGETLSYIYGTFAILPLFMIWLYMAWLIFLFGAELNAALHEVPHYERFELPATPQKK